MVDLIRRYLMRDLLKPVLITAAIVLAIAGITGAVASRTATAATKARTASRAAGTATVAPVLTCGQLASNDFSNVPNAVHHPGDGPGMRPPPAADHIHDRHHIWPDPDDKLIVTGSIQSGPAACGRLS
jgi:hypothetical protein